MLRKIIHVDMDCFYAAVEEKYRPELRGKPVGIGGPPNSRSVLCTANYAARKFGVRAAMPSSRAVRLCPDLILIPPNFELYRKESLAVREIFKRMTPLVEPLSLDEAYLDVTGAQHCEGSATRMAQLIRQQIFAETALTASAGIAPNKFLAKIASDWNKPNGQFVIKPGDIDDFMKTLKIEKIFGVGQVTAAKMHGLGLNTCADIQRQSLQQLIAWFGSRGPDLMDLARGIDSRPVHASLKSKSVTVEETYGTDITTLEGCLKQIPGLYRDWETRMNKMKEPPQIRGFVVKIKFFDFKSTTHEMSSTKWPTQENFSRLLERAWHRRGEPVRLIGLGVRLETKVSGTDPAQLSFPL